MIFFANRKSRFIWTWCLIWAVLMVAVILFSFGFTEGRLVFTLDDPYIHLAVAENIIQGGYGVNSAEYSSPSSSVIFPFILAVFEFLGAGPVGLLVLNVVLAGITVWLALDFLWKQLMDGQDEASRLFPNLIAIPVLFSLSPIALPLLGMEHTLHVFLVVLIIRGLIAIAEGQQVSWFLLTLAIVTLPFVRFEGFALAFAALAMIAFYGYWRLSATVVGLIIAGMTVWMTFLHGLGLPIWPSSVLVKSKTIARIFYPDETPITGASAFDVVSSKISGGLWQGVFTFSVVCLLTYFVLQARHSPLKSNSRALVALVVVAVLFAHIVAGSYGWFFRYEVYAVTLLALCSVFILAPTLRKWTALGKLNIKVGYIIIAAIIFSPYAYAAFKTPFAARGIYHQQYQMHRFATEYFSRSVAVNDLGLVSYQNSNHVTDLYGLSSERARRLHAQSRMNAATIDALVKDDGVEFAMIYEPVFKGAVPSRWCFMGELIAIPVSSTFGTVQFYAVEPAVAPKMHFALNEFARSLPTAVSFSHSNEACRIGK